MVNRQVTVIVSNRQVLLLLRVLTSPQVTADRPLIQKFVLTANEPSGTTKMSVHTATKD
jgi:hypothetical protein